MNVSYNWLKQYVDIDMPVEKAGEVLTDIGLEVEGIEKFESVKGGLQGLVIGKVTSCGRHPNADKLSVTKVDIGADRLLDIVCGAPNVAEGQTVVVATVGTILYTAEGESFKIKKSKIRGEVSEGMICAEDEIGLGTSHDGIMVLPDDITLGTPASEYFDIETDHTIEIGLTPNRSDATSHLGVAKDLAAALKVNFAYEGGVNIPDVSTFKVGNDLLPIEVKVENTTACPRYSGVVIKDVTIKPSPEWLQNRLKAIGVRPISNIVDITNFILHELGQPLHAFDYHQIEGKSVVVKNLATGSLFQSLDEEERKLDEEDLMICDAASNPMCIGGVFGGLTSGVKDETTTIFLESAHFQPRSIRRSSTRHGLRTDAAKVFEKGSDPNNTVFALKRAALMIQELAGGEIASEIVDIYPNPIEPKIIEVAYSRIVSLIGQAISNEEINTILDALHIKIVEADGDNIKVSVPTDKFDVTREADIIEEVLRIYGFNQIEIPSRVHSSLSFTQQPDEYNVRNTVSDLLTSNGFYEIMGLSIVQSKYFKTIYPVADENLVYINNTSNQHLDVMRPTMLFNGLEAIVQNQNRQNPNLKLYEFGKTYLKTGEDNFEENKHLTLFLAGAQQGESWLNTTKKEVSYYDLKNNLNDALSRIGVTKFQASPVQNDVFAYGLKYHRGKQVLAEFGRLAPKVAKEMGIKQAVFYADVNWDNILKSIKKNKIVMQELPKFFYTRRDLAFVVDKSVTFGEIEAIARKQGRALLTGINLFDVYEHEHHIGKGKKSCSVSFIFQDATKTLKDKEVDKIMNKIIYQSENKLGAVIRK